MQANTLLTVLDRMFQKLSELEQTQTRFAARLESVEASLLSNSQAFTKKQASILSRLEALETNQSEQLHDTVQNTTGVVPRLRSVAHGPVRDSDDTVDDQRKMLSQLEVLERRIETVSSQAETTPAKVLFRLETLEVCQMIVANEIDEKLIGLRESVDAQAGRLDKHASHIDELADSLEKQEAQIEHHHSVLYDHSQKIHWLRLPELHPAGIRALSAHEKYNTAVLMLTLAAHALGEEAGEAAMMRWLLRTQATCKYIRWVINHSDELRQLLCFSPDFVPGQVRINPLFHDRSLRRILSLGQVEPGTFVELPYATGRDARPLHLEVTHFTFTAGIHKIAFRHTDRCKDNEPWAKPRCKICTAKLSGYGSWEKMYLSQPAFKVAVEMIPAEGNLIGDTVDVEGDFPLGEVVERLTAEPRDQTE